MSESFEEFKTRKIKENGYYSEGEDWDHQQKKIDKLEEKLKQVETERDECDEIRELVEAESEDVVIDIKRLQEKLQALEKIAREGIDNCCFLMRKEALKKIDELMKHKGELK